MDKYPAVALFLACLFSSVPVEAAEFEWKTAAAESQGMSSAKLQALERRLIERNTKAFLVIRNDRIVHEWYGAGHGRRSRHYTASMAKALVGGVSLAVAISDGLISVDDPVSKHVPQWKSDPLKSQITVRHLGSHTSGIQDAWVSEESARGVNQGDFSGWEGAFWQWRGGGKTPPNDAFTLSREAAPVLFKPGTDYHYSNPGIAMLTYAVTASLKGTASSDVRLLLRDRVMRPIGVPDGEWSCGYGKTEEVDRLPLVASWGGGSYSANATARVARLMLRGGDWEGRQLIGEDAVKATISDAGTPLNGGMGWWTNAEGDFGKAPRDAFSGQGAGHQVVFVVPSLNLIAVRNGGPLDSTVEYRAALRQFLFDPLVNAMTDAPAMTSRPDLPYPRSPLIRELRWAPVDSIRRQAEGGDNWPITWADDGDLYTAYGDGWGFEPKIDQKLSLGLARVEGSPEDFQGVNVRSTTGEFIGQGANGKKASGLLMVDGVLYMLVRNAGNAQLGWSGDHGEHWEWSDWKFTESFGAPTLLNFGKNYAGARDGFVYLYSHDASSAYEPADHMVMARVPKDQMKDRAAYEFFKQLDNRGGPIWTKNVEERGSVFSHPGMCYRSGISYNAGLKRYLWCQIHPDTLAERGPRFQGGFGIYEAPEPWGPWRTVFYTREWDVGPGETSSFPPKWMSGDGKTMHLVFSGDDHFSVRKADVIVEEDQD